MRSSAEIGAKSNFFQEDLVATASRANLGQIFPDYYDNTSGVKYDGEDFDYSSLIKEKMGFNNRKTYEPKENVRYGVKKHKYSISQGKDGKYDAWKDIYHGGRFDKEEALPNNVLYKRQDQRFSSNRRYQPPAIKDRYDHKLKTFYDYETPTSDKKDYINDLYDESSDYFYVDDKPGAIDKISFGNYKPLKPPQEQSITKRVSNVLFSPLAITAFSVLALPFILGALYWLFVLNGPTPVVKARIDDVKLATENGENNYIVDEDSVTHSEVYIDRTGLYDLAKPYIKLMLEQLQSYTILNPDDTLL